MNTYNTGKVQIGCMYQPTTKPHHDRDALLLQSALLNTRQPSAAEIFFVRLVRRFWAWC
jgi:hypothetical protein